jgi:hypothetical protein
MITQTLTQKNVASSGVDVILGGLTTLNHVTVTEFHGLSSLTTELSGNDEFATLGLVLHNETENTIAGSSDSQTVKKLVTERLGLSDGAEGTVGNTLGVELDVVVGEVESLLNNGGELTDAATLLTKNILGSGGLNDDLGSGGSHTDLNTGVTFLGELALEELVKLGVENAIGNELTNRIECKISDSIVEHHGTFFLE